MKEAMKQAIEPIDSVWHEGLVVTQPKTLLQSTVDDHRKGETYTAHKDVDLLSLQAF